MNRSWFAGVAGRNLDFDVLHRISANTPGSVVYDSAPYAGVVAGGPARTSVHYDTAECSVVVAGSALETTSSQTYRLLKRKALAERTDSAFRSDDLLGQFASVCLTADQIRISTDRNGLRSVYVRERAGLVEFATHLHLLKKLGGDLKLDVESFGSHWFCHNLLREDIFLDGISRICGGETAVISIEPNRERPHIRRESAALPSVPNSDEPISWLRGLIRGMDHNIKLSLSGGLDSRLLACLNMSEQSTASAFVFGAVGEPEVDIATSVARSIGMFCNVIPDASVDDCIRSGIAFTYCRDNWCTTPITAISHLANYDRVFANGEDSIMIDGGFGEICRAQFYRRLRLVRLASRIRPASLGEYVRALSFHRCDVFSADALDSMKAGIEADVSRIVESLFANDSARPEDDLAAELKRRNFFGLVQSWVDSFGPSAMPFAQEEYVQASLNASLRRRRYGPAYKQKIRDSCKQLTRIRRVKSGRLIPFRMPEILSPFALRIVDPRPAGTSLRKSELLKTVLFDLVQSRSFGQSAIFDREKAENILKQFYDESQGSEAELAWLATLLLWRETNGIN